MPSKTKKIFTLLFFILIFTLLFHKTFAKYVIETIDTVAKIDIDRCPPNIELIDAISSNIDYPTYANQTHTITIHLKLTEKNIIRNNLSSNTIKIAVGNRYSINDQDIIPVTFKNFSLISDHVTEKIYELSFTHTTGNGSLAIIIPEGLVEDKSRFNQ
ncbi:MAG: hypothetical protein HFJ33_01700 [Clostridia bacterium]|nr:hypothetical protein [Clostridia bacterium]